MKMRYLLLAVAGIIHYYYSSAQPVIIEPTDIKEVLIESIAASGGESKDYDAILLELEYLREHPLNLNTSERSELQKLSFLTEFQISSLLDYRQKNGRFLTIYELQVVYGFTDEVIGLILPFVTVPDQEPAEPRRLNEISGWGSHKVVLRTQRMLEKARGYSVYDSLAGSMHYPGNPWLYNLRYGFELKQRLQAGFTVEKDPGENVFSASNRAGFDFNSAYIMLHDMGAVNSIIVGDYRLAFGQGLAMWSGTAPGKSSMPVNIVKRQDAIKAFTSNDENNFFRGVAADATWGKFTLTGFFSSKKRDANITDTLEQGKIYFSSFQESGYHRTLSEIADEKSVRETALGTHILFRNNFLKVGSTLVAYQFDKYLEAGEDLKDIHDFAGNHLLNWGIDYSVMLKRVQCFGETSYGNNYWATLNGLMLHVSKYASFSLLYRNFGTGYFSLHSSAFSEGSSDSNEEGFYAGMVIHPAPRWKISGYADLYRFPWLKSGLSVPASGSDYLLQVDYAPCKTVCMLLRLKADSNPEDELLDSQIIPEIGEIQHTGFRYHISYRLNRKVMMQNRFEWVNVRSSTSESSQGALLYHDLEYRIDKIPVVLDFRFAWFNTGSYASRIYAYEQDITTGYSFSPMHENGCRTYLLARLEISKQLSCWLRFSSTHYFNMKRISTGFDEINAPSRSDFKVQLAWRI